MCKPIKDFKLCTCGEMKRKPKNNWVLYRGQKESDTLVSTMGTIAFNEDEEIFRNIDTQNHYIKELINTKNFFDFEYTPQSEDRLEIEVMKYHFYFKFSEGKWQKTDEFGYFDTPKDFYNEFMKGKIK